ncbi:MAG: PstS family phosphate ABC transporter substrate-binding protein [Alphaproteobacteria bacterium]|nr:PstS family phosphate ABC transporter substrate-binding protein [Alphaproteobacteria bacterium]
MKPCFNVSTAIPGPRSGSCSVFLVAALAVFFLPSAVQARDNIHIVGSSTVYPFTTVVAEEFGKTTGFSAPIVESTGTGGGIKLLCGGVGESFPDMANASRAIKESELKLCADNGVKDVTEIKIGYDGIIIANSKEKELYDLSKQQIFSALAKQVPGKDGKLVNNPYKMWSEIDPALPAVKIEVYGPPTTSGTRDAFVELVMEKACAGEEAFKAAWPEEEMRKKNCHLMREDGHYIESGENDNLIVQKLRSNPQAFGIFGYSFLEQNLDTLNGNLVDGVEPTFEAIADGSYPVARPLFIYAKNKHVDFAPGIREFLKELVSDKAAGMDGYLAVKGLIPLPEEELQEMQKRVSDAFSVKK